MHSEQAAPIIAAAILVIVAVVAFYLKAIVEMLREERIGEASS